MREEQRRLADTISHLRALFWRLPPQSSRCAVVLPEPTGIGARDRQNTPSAEMVATAGSA
jgi:hypothetical protein